MNYKERKPGIWGLMLLCLVYIAIVGATVVLNRQNDMMIPIGHGKLPINSFNGVLTAILSLIAIIMVCLYHRSGFICAMVFAGAYTVSMLRAVLFGRELSPLPGIANTVILIITQILLYKQLARREREIVMDFLTGLYNRRGLMRILTKRVQEKNAFYLYYIDLDDFKFINDNFGHECGDRVLKIIAERMKQAAGRDAVVSRLGGDEFVVLLSADKEVNTTAQKLLEALSAKMMLTTEEREIDCYVTASIGIVWYPTDSRDARMLMKYADIAMYQAKKEGKNKFYLFDRAIEREVLRQAEVEGFIKKSLAGDHFYMVYQPQFDIHSKKLRGFETLLRMNAPDGTPVSPGEFIPVAERTDLILRIDEYVLKHALMQFGSRMKECGEGITLSVNVSAKNICRYGFAGMVKKILLDTDFPPENLELEITEYCLAQSIDTAVDNIQKLKRIGVQLALDDFGTGYASLSNLSKLSIDLLKIDKSFIDELGQDSRSEEFIQAVISIGHLHECKVISEGVENLQQLDILQKLGCDYLQGFLWGRPVSFEDAVKLM